MGADIYLKSVWEPWWKENEKRICAFPNIDQTSDGAAVTAATNKLYDDMRGSGGYFRNGYNAGDVMWAMGLSWQRTVEPMLDADSYLPVDRARELLAMIETRPLTKERLAQHYFNHMTHGSDQHPVSSMLRRLAQDPEDSEEDNKRLLPYRRNENPVHRRKLWRRWITSFGCATRSKHETTEDGK